jgi:hypothetical protein
MRRSNPAFLAAFMDYFAEPVTTRWLAMTYEGRKLPFPSCPRLSRASTSYFPTKTWMAGTSSAKTRFALLPGHDEYFFSYFTTAAVWPNRSLRSSSVRIAGWP